MLSGKHTTLYGNIRLLNFTEIQGIMARHLPKFQNISGSRWEEIIQQIRQIDSDIKIPPALVDLGYIVGEHRTSKYADFWRIALPLVDPTLFEFRPYYGKNATNRDRYRADRLNDILGIQSMFASAIDDDRKTDSVTRLTDPSPHPVEVKRPIQIDSGRRVHIIGEAHTVDEYRTTEELMKHIAFLETTLARLHRQKGEFDKQIKIDMKKLGVVKAKLIYITLHSSSKRFASPLHDEFKDIHRNLTKIYTQKKRSTQVKQNAEALLVPLRRQLHRQLITEQVNIAQKRNQKHRGPIKRKPRKRKPSDPIKREHMGPPSTRI